MSRKKYAYHFFPRDGDANKGLVSGSVSIDSYTYMSICIIIMSIRICLYVLKVFLYKIIVSKYGRGIDLFH